MQIRVTDPSDRKELAKLAKDLRLSINAAANFSLRFGMKEARKMLDQINAAPHPCLSQIKIDPTNQPDIDDPKPSKDPFQCCVLNLSAEGMDTARCTVRAEYQLAEDPARSFCPEHAAMMMRWQRKTAGDFVKLPQPGDTTE